MAEIASMAESRQEIGYHQLLVVDDFSDMVVRSDDRVFVQWKDGNGRSPRYLLPSERENFKPSQSALNNNALARAVGLLGGSFDGQLTFRWLLVILKQFLAY